jgi:serine/threonine-protein kinase
MERFLIEAKAINLLSHRHIIKMHDIGLTKGGQPYMIMDFIDGVPLSEVLEQEIQISMARFLNLFIQSCDALGHAHSRHVLHRDLKPSNMMLTRINGQEEVRIMDFGVAKVVNDPEYRHRRLTKPDEVVGSPMYMSPEQAGGKAIDHRSDIYSLGLVMYEAITGTPTFEGPTVAETMVMQLVHKPKPMMEASRGQYIDPRLEAVVFRLLEKNPNDRYQTMEALKQDLMRLRS